MASKQDKERVKQLKREYKRLAKAADGRLRTLESHANDPHFQNILGYAYRKAEMYTSQYNSKGSKVRFDVVPPDNINTIQARINEVNDFLNMATSSIQKIKHMYIEKTKTINDRYGTNFKWQELAAYYEEEKNREIDEKYGSKTLIKVLGRFANTRKYDIQKMSPDDIKTKVLTGDAIEDSIIKNLLKEGYDYKSLFT